MKKINIQSFSPKTKNTGGPVRKLAAAARAVMEPVEHRVMMSTSPATLLAQPIGTITAKFETQALPNSGEAASGTTIWVNPTSASQSTIIGTDKLGGIAVYDLSGNQIQYLSDSAYYKVDTRSGFSLGGKDVSIVAAGRIDGNELALFKVDPSTRKLVDVANGSIKLTIGGTMNGVAMYQSANTGKTYVFVSNTTGGVEQFLLTDNGNGKVSAKSVRSFNVGSAAEGLTADDANGSLYVSQDGKAIWKYGAEPTDGSVRVQIDNTSGYVGSESESLALYSNNDGSGYLIASRQDSDDYVVYDRRTGDYVTKFSVSNGSVDGTSSSDGIAVTSSSLGSGLTSGGIAIEDDSNNGNQNYKLVSWGDLANAQTPLAIDSSIVVTSLSGGATATAAATTSSVSVNSLSLYEANSNNKLATLTNGVTIDLADYAGTDLNVRAAVSGSVGSVKFGVNSNSNVRTENYTSFDLAGTGGVWNPSTGTYTITATAYTAHNAGGNAGASFSITFKVIDSSVDTSGTPATAAPGAPKSVTATATSTKVTVKWTAADSLADGYKVERSTDGGKTYTTVGVVTTASFSDTRISPSTTYTYKVTAYNSVGWATASSTPSVTTSSSVVLVVDAPVPTNRPSIATTGPAAGTKYTNVGSFHGVSNTVYSNLKITGAVTLTGLSNVTLINCIIDGNGAGWAVRCDGATNITIQNCEIYNVASAAVYGNGFKAINNYVHESAGDAFKPLSDVVIQGNYISDLGYNSADAHADGVQIRGGSNIKIVGNYFDMPIDVANTKSNSSLFVQLDVGDVTFSGNWVRGGNFALHVFSDLAGGNATIKVTNNVYYAGSAQFGFAQIGTGVVFTGNVTDTGLVATVSTK